MGLINMSKIANRDLFNRSIYCPVNKNHKIVDTGYCCKSLENKIESVYRCLDCKKLYNERHVIKGE